jgi:toxin-antitoxin system PIN domain toxin
LNLCDSNVWLALVLSGHAHHEAVQAWFSGVRQRGAVLFCRSTQQSLLRLLTNSAVLAPYGNPPLGNQEAWSVYEQLAADHRVGMRAVEPSDLEPEWARLALGSSASPKLWMDAYLAAFALTGGYKMVTTDHAYQQFEGLDLLLLGGSSPAR